MFWFRLLRAAVKTASAQAFTIERKVKSITISRDAVGGVDDPVDLRPPVASPVDPLLSFRLLH